jgi:hypothetical protein
MSYPNKPTYKVELFEDRDMFELAINDPFKMLHSWQTRTYPEGGGIIAIFAISSKVPA